MLLYFVHFFKHNIFKFIVISTNDFSTPGQLTASSMNDLDFTALSSHQVDFNPDDSTKDVQITIYPDDLYEADEQFQVFMHDTDTAEALGALNKAIVTILDDDNCTYLKIDVIRHIKMTDKVTRWKCGVLLKLRVSALK